MKASELGLNDLRSRLSIIPQVGLLFQIKIYMGRGIYNNIFESLV